MSETIKVEFIESYIKIDDGDYRWNDNHGEVVRCKECKHFDIEYVENEHGKDDEYPMCLRFEDYTFDVKADDYCSYGERKESE